MVGRRGKCCRIESDSGERKGLIFEVIVVGRRGKCSRIESDSGRKKGNYGKG